MQAEDGEVASANPAQGRPWPTWFRVTVCILLLLGLPILVHHIPRTGVKVPPLIDIQQNNAAPPSQSAAAALGKPVIVAIKHNPHPMIHGPYSRDVPCSYQGKPIKCQWVDAWYYQMPTADAVWFHMPEVPRRDAPHQLTVGYTMESPYHMWETSDLAYMDQWNITMSYRLCAHVVMPYLFEEKHSHNRGCKERLGCDSCEDGCFERMQMRELVPWEEKLDAIHYINSNCHPANGRNDIVKALMDLKRLPVHAYGDCLRNMKVKKDNSALSLPKMESMRPYKFCIAMENSNYQDYVTEKIFEAFSTGCIPIYQGAPNVLDFVPSPNSFINYTALGSPEKLMDYLEQLAGDKDAWMKFFEWKLLPFEQLLPGYQKLVALFDKAPHSQCQVCQLIMDLRIHPRSLEKTHCLRIETWQAAAKTGGSSWTPASDAVLQGPDVHRWKTLGDRSS